MHKKHPWQTVKKFKNILDVLFDQYKHGYMETLDFQISALRATDGSFRLNMDWRLSRFGDQPGAGTVFTYAKNSGPDCPGECITAEGPTDVAINVVVCIFYCYTNWMKKYMSHDMWFPTMWHSDMNRLRRACAASCKAQVYLLDFFCSGIQFNLLLSPYPCLSPCYILIYMF